MSDDEFSNQGNRAIQATVASAAGLVSGPAGVALAVGAAVTFNVFEALAARNDEALREFRIAALEDELLGVRDKLLALEASLRTEGKTPDRQDPLTQNAVASEFVRGVSEARTAEKKTAIVNATVAQFDPRKGSPASRDHWLRRVREISETELALILLLNDHEAVTFHQHTVFKVPLAPASEATSDVLAMPEQDAIAFESVASQIAGGGPGRLVYSIGGRNIKPPGSKTAAGPGAFALTADGRILISYCKDD